jgi:hypothetical protein
MNPLATNGALHWRVRSGMEKTGLPKLKQIMAERVKSRLDPFTVNFFGPISSIS